MNVYYDQAGKILAVSPGDVEFAKDVVATKAVVPDTTAVEAGQTFDIGKGKVVSKVAPPPPIDRVAVIQGMSLSSADKVALGQLLGVTLP